MQSVYKQNLHIMDPSPSYSSGVLDRFLALAGQIRQRALQIDVLDARLEHLDMYQQHLVSVNLRCDLLEEQVKRLGDSQDEIHWVATSATVDNLRSEFKYITERFQESNSNSNANSNSNYECVEPARGDDESMLNRTVASVFSDAHTQLTDDTEHFNFDISRNLLPELHGTKSRPQRKMLKKESFLNIQNQPLNANPNVSNNATVMLPMKKFKICNYKSTPTTKTSIPDLKSQVKTFNFKSKISSNQMPLIREEEIPPVVSKKCNSNYANHHPHHQRHSSLPETVSLAYTEYSDIGSTFENSSYLKHFVSCDVDLDSVKYSTPKYLSRNKHRNITKMISSSPLKVYGRPSNPQHDLSLEHLGDDIVQSEYFEEYNDDDDQYDGYDEEDDDDGDDETASNDSYGDIECQPFLLQKMSQMTLRHSKSHESVLNNIIEKAQPSIDASSNLRLKEQTIKWIQPNRPSTTTTNVAASTARITTSSGKVSALPILESRSGSLTLGTSTIHSTPSTIVSYANEDSRHNGTSLNGFRDGSSAIFNWGSAANKVTEFLSPHNIPPKPNSITKKIDIPTSAATSIKSFGRRANDFNEIEEQPIGSWITSFVPNTAFAVPETGKRIATPSGRSFHPKGNLEKMLASNKPLSINHKRNLANSGSYNSPLRSDIIIQKKNIIKHGNLGTNTDVQMTRVSHGALREALDVNII